MYMYMYMFAYQGKKYTYQADDLRAATDMFYSEVGYKVPSSVHRRKA